MIWTFATVCFLILVILVIGVIAIYFIPQIISFLLEPKSGSMTSEDEKIPEESPSKDIDSEKMKGRTNSSSAYLSEKTSREKESPFTKLNPFSRKEKCNECGTELEYREDYQSHYCPKCRTYK